jgi:signal transduction histidine kinase
MPCQRRDRHARWDASPECCPEAVGRRIRYRSKVDGITGAPTAVGIHPPIERLAALQAHRDPVSLASEALSILIEDFGAMAGSLFYATRPPLRVRQGELSEALTAHVAQWEADVEQRIAAGPWEITGPEPPLPAWQSIEGTGQKAVYSLILESSHVAGTICLFFEPEHLPTGSQRTLLSRCLQTVGTAVGLVGELALTKQRLGQLSLFYQVAQVVASTFDLDQVLDDILELATAILDASAAILMMIDKETGELVFEHIHGEVGDPRDTRGIPLSEGILGWVAAHGEPLVSNDVQSDPHFKPAVDSWVGMELHSMVCVPIQIRGKSVGVLGALNKRSEMGFDSEDLSLMMTTATQAAIAIEHNQLYQNLRDEQERIIRAQVNVRRQVARNLHDGTVQFLSSISMGIDHLERLLELKPKAAKSELQALRDLTRQATQQARLAIFELRPLILETQGLIPALETYVQQLQDSEKFQVHLEVHDVLPPLNSSVAATVFSIVQEAVTNSKKHAGPTEMWLRLSRDDDCLQVVVEDNGMGFDFEAVEQDYDRKGSIGLLSMKERADLIGGHVEIRSSTAPPQAGTKVILRIPLPSEEDEATT